MYWAEYLTDILNQDKSLDNIKVNMEGMSVDLPDIIKASVFMVEKMISHQGQNNIFVFPDDNQAPFLFMLSKVIHNVISGNVENQYSPEQFEAGQLLKIGNCITQFLGIGDNPMYPGTSMIYLKFSDLDRYGCPLDMAPYFQITDTKKRLSKKASYDKEKKKINVAASEGKKTINDLKALLTHIGESVCYVSTVADSERKAEELKIDGEQLFQYLLVAKADYEGELHFYKGKYVGTPALIFSSQLSYVNEVISRGTKVQSVIINLNELDINTQLDDLDYLMKKKIPILCVVDTIKSMELEELKNRGFNIWRWDAESIVDRVCGSSGTFLDKKISTCISSSVEYHRLTAPSISEAFLRLYKYNRKIEEESPRMNKIFSSLIHLAYLSVRSICDITESEHSRAVDLLDECANSLEIEKSFIDPQMYTDFEKTINSYHELLDGAVTFPKTEEIYKLLIEKRFPQFYIICSNQDNTERVKRYWENRLVKSGYRPTIYVVYPKEFIGLKNVYGDIAILSGWFSATVVKQIIYSYKVKDIHVFTYECEEVWRRAHTKAWKNGLNNESNRSIVKKSFSDKIEKAFENAEIIETLDSNESEALKQQDDFDLLVQESRYRQYTIRGNYDENQVVQAKPVGFVGGEFALFTEGHKILCVTKIINQTGKQIEKKDVESLEIGDFIVVREADKDIIREVADRILDANGKADYRDTAALWKEALRIEEAFSSLDSIYNRLIEAGCTRNYQTVKNWIQSDDQIIPQDPGDLKYIAEVTGDSVLMEKMDEVVEAGRFIMTAHIKSGRILSERLSECIATKLINDKSIDPFNIWEPIEMELDDVGAVKVLKIIDIGQEYIAVDASNSNKIMDEEKENILWQE